MDDLEHLLFEVFLIVCAFILGGLCAHWDHQRRRMPPPDPRAIRGYTREY
jgi:hypothetical protein